MTHGTMSLKNALHISERPRALHDLNNLRWMFDINININKPLLSRCFSATKKWRGRRMCNVTKNVFGKYV